MIQAVPEVFRTAISFLVVLGVLVFVHELGHYLAARWTGVHVETFSIGFGQALTSWVDRRGTVWKLAWIPLGGYVKLHGQERAEDMSPERRALRIPGRTFHEKSVGRRAIVVAAGPAANFVLAAALFFALFAAFGRPTALPVVTEVLPGSAAAEAGIVAQDRIVAIVGASIATFEALQAAITPHPGERVNMTVRRAGADKIVPVTIGGQAADGREELVAVHVGQRDVQKKHVRLPREKKIQDLPGACRRLHDGSRLAHQKRDEVEAIDVVVGHEHRRSIEGSHAIIR